MDCMAHSLLILKETCNIRDGPRLVNLEDDIGKPAAAGLDPLIIVNIPRRWREGARTQLKSRIAAAA